MVWLEAIGLSLLLISLLVAPPLVAMYVCRILHRWLYQQTDSRSQAALLGGILGVPTGAVISVGPLYLYTTISHKLGLFSGTDGANVGLIFSMLFAFGGAIAGLVFGAWPTRVE